MTTQWSDQRSNKKCTSVKRDSWTIGCKSLKHPVYDISYIGKRCRKETKGVEGPK